MALDWYSEFPPDVLYNSKVTFTYRVHISGQCMFICQRSAGTAIPAAITTINRRTALKVLSIVNSVGAFRCRNHLRQRVMRSIACLRLRCSILVRRITRASRSNGRIPAYRVWRIICCTCDKLHRFSCSNCHSGGRKHRAGPSQLIKRTIELSLRIDLECAGPASSLDRLP